jgi:hypothetical protein
VSERIRFAFDPKNWEVVLFDCFEAHAGGINQESSVLDMFGNIPFIPNILYILGAEVHVNDSEYNPVSDSRTEVFTQLRERTQQRSAVDVTELQTDSHFRRLLDDLTLDPLLGNEDPFPVIKTGVHPEALLEYEPFRTLVELSSPDDSNLQYTRKRIEPTDDQPFNEYRDGHFSHVLIDPPYGVNYGDAFTPADGVELTLKALDEADRLLASDGVLVISFPKEIPESEKWGDVWEARWRGHVIQRAAKLGFDTSGLQIPGYDTNEAIDDREIVAITK